MSQPWKCLHTLNASSFSICLFINLPICSFYVYVCLCRKKTYCVVTFYESYVAYVNIDLSNQNTMTLERYMEVDKKLKYTGNTVIGLFF